MVAGGMAQPVDFRTSTWPGGAPTKIITTPWVRIYIYESAGNYDPPASPPPKPTIKQKRAAQRAGFRALLSDWFPAAPISCFGPSPEKPKPEQPKIGRWRSRALRAG
jgi:hypothetical protein